LLREYAGHVHLHHTVGGLDRNLALKVGEPSMLRKYLLYIGLLDGQQFCERTCLLRPDAIVLVRRVDPQYTGR
jgi:hypothetical protein